MASTLYSSLNTGIRAAVSRGSLSSLTEQKEKRMKILPRRVRSHSRNFRCKMAVDGIPVVDLVR